ncbi:MAG: cysteine desulfurase family protein [Rhodospirillaceae bacterium]|nr:cysteine desulfurase family protein [Rhodospirillaceae bacterium]
MRQAAYLDYNATVPLRPQARAALVAALDSVGNASSIHRFGRLARRTIEDAREQLAAFLNVLPRQIVFTAGATEANSGALRATGRRRVLAGATEHPSVLAASPAIEIVSVDSAGVVDLAHLSAMLVANTEPALVSIMAANNETGTIQPVADAAAIAHDAGAILHCDAVQAAGRIPLDFPALNADLMSVSSHKMGGPTGIGALVIRDGLALEPLLRGGGQELGRRAGTENVAAIAGFGAAAVVAGAELASERYRVAALRDRLENEIRAIAPAVRIFGNDAERLPNTSCFGLAGLASDVQVIALDLAGIAVSAGAACSSGKVAGSHVLGAMGVKPDVANAAIRVSLGWQSTQADVDRFLDAWRALATRDDVGTAVAPAA